MLDTNVIVASLKSARGASRRILEQIGTGRFELALSTPVLLEYEELFHRMLPPLGVDPSSVIGILDVWASHSVLQDIHFLWRPFLPDREDDLMLELAFNARCSHIVTFNLKDFRGIAELGIEAVTPGQFLQLLEQEAAL